MTDQQWVAKYGSWAVVTGASDGIGRAMAFESARAGLNVVLVARRRHLLEQIAQEISECFKVQTCVVEADFARAEAVESLMQATQPLDVGLLVAAAGFGTSGKFIHLPIEREIDMLRVNCEAVLTLTRHFAERFAQQRRGGIVLFSSLVAFQGVPFSAHYAATKAYIQSLAEGIYHELAPLGVDVLATAPGSVQSGFGAVADMRMTMALDPATVARDTLKALGRGANVRPGLLSKLLIGSLDLLPRGWRVRAMAGIMKGMTQHQQV